LSSAFGRSSFEPWVSFRYLKSRRREVFISIIAIISVLGVAVSVMVLDIVLAVMTGFEGELKSKLIDTSSHVTIRKFGGELSDWQQIREKVLSVVCQKYYSATASLSLCLRLFLEMRLLLEYLARLVKAS